MEALAATGKDGRPVRIRPARPADAPAIFSMHRDVVATGEGAVGTLSDLDEAKRLPELRSLAEQLTGLHGAHLVAEWVGVDRLIGASGVWRMKPSLLRHVALMSVEVHPTAQGMGVGRLLFQRALDWATDGDGRQEPRVERLELYVRADNVRARRLYESLGFEVEGVRRRFVRLGAGRYVDDLVMARLLSGTTECCGEP